MKKTIAISVMILHAPTAASFLFFLDTMHNKHRGNTHNHCEENSVRHSSYHQCSRRRGGEDSLLLWPFRMSSNDGGDGGEHLIRAGQELKIAAISIGPSNYACPNLLSDAGTSIAEIGEYWSESWEAVTYAAEDAYAHFHSLSQLQGNNHPKLATMYSAIACELKQISSIVGCTSIGPLTAVPNLVSLSETLNEVAKYVEKCGDECSDDSRAFGKSFRTASKSIRSLAKSHQ